MALENNLYQGLRVVDRREHQTHRRRWTADQAPAGGFEPLVSPLYLPPFQLRRGRGQFVNLTSVVLYTAAGDKYVRELRDDLAADELQAYSFGTYEQVVYFGEAPLDRPLPTGRYYLRFRDGVNEWFSEVFQVRAFDQDSLAAADCNMLKLTWGNTTDLAGLYYTAPGRTYTNRLIFAADLGPPEWATVNEGSEDGQGVFFPEFKRAAKEWSFELYAPEYLLDVLALLPLHDAVYIETYDGYSAKMENIGYAPDAEVERGYRRVEVTFTVEFFVAVDCNDNMPFENVCYRATREVIARVDEGTSNYNNNKYVDSNGNTRTMPINEQFFGKRTNGTFAVYIRQVFGKIYLNESLDENTGTVSTLHGNDYLHTIQDENGNYRYWPTPVFDSLSRVFVSGQSFARAGVELWLRLSDGSGVGGQNGYLYKYATNDQFEALGFPIDEELTHPFDEFKLKARGLNCVIAQTDWEFIPPDKDGDQGGGDTGGGGGGGGSSAS